MVYTRDQFIWKVYFTDLKRKGELLKVDGTFTFDEAKHMAGLKNGMRPGCFFWVMKDMTTDEMGKYIAKHDWI